jgi:hypothetical protein
VWFEFQAIPPGNRDSPYDVYRRRGRQSSYTSNDAEDGQIYVEIRKKDGDLETGNLLSITLDEVVFSSGYRYEIKADTNIRVENVRVVHKDDVTIMKVW